MNFLLMFVKQCMYKTNIQLFRKGIDASLAATSTVQDQVKSFVATSTVQDQVIATGSVTLSNDGIAGNFANCAPRVHFS